MCLYVSYYELHARVCVCFHFFKVSINLYSTVNTQQISLSNDVLDSASVAFVMVVADLALAVGVVSMMKLDSEDSPELCYHLVSCSASAVSQGHTMACLNCLLV